MPFSCRTQTQTGRPAAPLPRCPSPPLASSSSRPTTPNLPPFPYSIMASTALYPPFLLSLPLTLSERLPPSLQSIDPQTALVMHVFLSLFTTLFTLHPYYLLPLSLFGLIASHPTLTALLPHFLVLWVVSIPMDVLWLLRKSADANLLVTAAVGASMVLKLPSAAAVAQVVRQEGYIQEDGVATGFAGVSLPGSGRGLWSGTGGAAGGGDHGGELQRKEDEMRAHRWELTLSRTPIYSPRRLQQRICRR